VNECYWSWSRCFWCFYRRRQWRSRCLIATTCDPGGRPGPCTRTSIQPDILDDINLNVDETIDCEVAYDGAWLLGVADSKLGLRASRTASSFTTTTVYPSLPHPLKNCWLPELLSRLLLSWRSYRSMSFYRWERKSGGRSSLLLSSWRSFGRGLHVSQVISQLLKPSEF
jgi:hypothetical protein